MKVELELNEIKELLGDSSNVKKESMLDKFVGEYVICRTRNEGINFGKVAEIDETGVVLDECRRIWYHKPQDKNTAWYEGVAQTGLSADSKISGETTKVIVENYSLTICSNEAVNSIKTHPTHGQN